MSIAACLMNFVKILRLAPLQFFSFDGRVKFIFGLNSNHKVAIKAQRCLQIILRNVFLRKFTVTILVNYTNDSANIECWGFKPKLDGTSHVHKACFKIKLTAFIFKRQNRIFNDFLIIENL